MMNKILCLSQQSTMARNALQRVQDILHKESLPQSNHKQIPANFELSLENVSFKYPNTNVMAIENVSIEVKEGQHIALVGASGSGKTTLVNLLARFWDVSLGSIKLGGIDIKNIDEQWLFSNISFVFQNPHIYMASILDNIREAKSKATENEVIQVIKSARCESIIQKLPDGIHTIIVKDSTFLSDVFDVVLEKKSLNLDLMLYFGYSLFFLFVLFTFYVLQYNSSYFRSYETSFDTRIRLLKTLKSLPLSFFGKKDLSDITSTVMTDVRALENAFSQYIPDLIGAILSTVIICIGLLFFNVKMALAMLWVVPVSILFCVLTQKKQNIHTIKAKGIHLLYLEKIRECIDNIIDIKANNRISAHLGFLQKHFDAYEKSIVMGEVAIGMYIVGAQMIMKIGIISTMFMGVYLLSNNEISLFLFVICLWIVTRIYDPMSMALMQLAALYSTLPSIERMKNLENTKIQTGKQDVQYGNYNIMFDNVTFAYNDSKIVLDEISFTAKQGEVTALIGPSGGGKSTALKLAGRFWDLHKGKITLGNEDISQIDPETLLKSFSIVFQDVTLFDNTVMENIRIGKKGATNEEVIAAAKAAHCHEFVQKLPQGYETFVGENGTRLSGGQRQRISIARALLKDAPVILLDEATSSIDVMSESVLQKAIDTLIKDKTVVVVAHRMRTIMGADNIILIKNGKVFAQGNHKSLMQENEEYNKMVKMQMPLQYNK